jgi:cephalosporin hydroxylase
VFPFWDDVIAPLIDAVGPRRVVEIGALRGETTVLMLGRLGPDCELHVIDPLPQFDPSEHEQAFPGRYIFHLGISHDVLPTLPPADVALVDGDHNWFTVFHELRMLAATARDAAASLPLLILHDVTWPYGRRDLYYEPSRIPEEFRQPYRQAGMRPGTAHLFPNRGMNVELYNAEREGGPRNGVMTALEDFMAEYDRPLRCLVIPSYFGLAIVAEEDRLAANPALAAMFDRFESLAGQRELVAVTERIRLDEAVFVQARIRALDRRITRGSDRYLEVVKAALLDEHYIDNEARIEYLAAHLGSAQPDLAPLRDPARLLPIRFRRLATARAAGRSLDGADNVAFFPYTEMGRTQLDRLDRTLQSIRTGDVAGDVAEIGVGRGGGAIFMRAFLEAHEVAGRMAWVIDEFLATARDAGAGDESAVNALGRFKADLNQVRDGFARFGLLDDRVRFLQGPPAQRLADAPAERLAVVRIGEGLGASLGPVLEAVHSRLSPDGTVIVSGTGDPDVFRTVTDTRHRLGITAPLERIDWNSVTWQQPASALAPTGQALPAARPVPASSVALSVIVVFHNMRREAQRTLQSLSRSYQADIEGLEYEVIVVDNGSNPDQRLTEEMVHSYGAEFRLLDTGESAAPSPTVALNAGIAVARGDALALMIDGAHVLTPRVLHYGMAALDVYAPAVVATQQWYVGPGQQGDAQQSGYDQVVEDRLFAGIEWPTDGYRLFEIGHFIGERDWFDGIAESNCLFVPRKLLEQMGAFDDQFSMPGGGYANLDLFERLCLAPGITPASILGEGTFHQVHGGITTNEADEATRRDRVASYGQHFLELRGRTRVGLDRPVKYVGAVVVRQSLRTRSRRGTNLGFDAMRDPVRHAGDAAPVIVPDEVKLGAIEAIWESQAWLRATWLGHKVNRFPTDLYVYQELIARLRPDLIVVVGDDDGLGGRALFAASICDQLDHGRVVAVGRSEPAERPSHPRISHLGGRPETAEVGAAVRDLAGDGAGALVLLGLGNPLRVSAAFAQYAPLVPVGGYVVIENTVVNGRPAASGFGTGPHEAVGEILTRHRGFVSDPNLERYTVTFNRNGFLRRER